LLGWVPTAVHAVADAQEIAARELPIDAPEDASACVVQLAPSQTSAEIVENSPSDPGGACTSATQLLEEVHETASNSSEPPAGVL
jgi:hypothetical protein